MTNSDPQRTLTSPFCATVPLKELLFSSPNKKEMNPSVQHGEALFQFLVHNPQSLVQHLVPWKILYIKGQLPLVHGRHIFQSLVPNPYSLFQALDHITFFLVLEEPNLSLLLNLETLFQNSIRAMSKYSLRGPLKALFVKTLCTVWIVLPTQQTYNT